MSNVGVAFYRTIKTPEPLLATMISWERLIEKLSTAWVDKEYPEIDGKSQAPLWSPVKLKVAQRLNKNVQYVFALVLDFDNTEGVPPSIEMTRELFGQWRGFAYTTKSHTEESPRSRIAIMLDHGLTPKEFLKVWKWAKGLAESAGLLIDEKCKDACRAYYVPFGKFDFQWWDGPELNTVDIISGAALDRPDGADIWELRGDTIIRNENENTTVEQWFYTSKPGEKLKCYCPRVEESTLGSTFLRRRASGVMLVCTSDNHGHAVPLRGWWQNPAAGESKPAIPIQVRDLLEWKLDGSGNRTGVAPTLQNLNLILQFDPNWSGRLWYNILTQNPMLGDNAMRDVDITFMRATIEHIYRVRYGKQDMVDSVGSVCDLVKRDPLLEELNLFQWDEVPRVDTWLINALGVEDTPLNRSMGSMWLLEAVARAYCPGAKCDATLILYGGQGVKKGTVLKALIGEKWYSETPISIGSRQAYIQLQRAWVHELAEVDSIKSRENSAVKAFLSATSDTYVPPYGTYAITVPRRCVFCGTTNEREFNTDPTGLWIAPRLMSNGCVPIENNFLPRLSFVIGQEKNGGFLNSWTPCSVM
jgi:hypothetical protein